MEPSCCKQLSFLLNIQVIFVVCTIFETCSSVFFAQKHEAEIDTFDPIELLSLVFVPFETKPEDRFPILE